MTDAKHVRDRVAAIGGPILIALLFLCLITIATLEYNSYYQGKRSIAQQQQITSLLKQHSGDLATQKRQSAQFDAAEQIVARDANYIVAWQQWAQGIIEPLCVQAAPGLCPPPPTLPGG